MKLQFRRHMVVTLLSRYAMYSYTGSLGPTGQVRLASYRDGPDDAAATLNHIETAQKQLRAYISGLGPAGSVSKGLPMLASGLIPFEESERLHRVVAVLQVLIDADRPLIGRAKNLVLNILGAIGGGPSAISRILDQIADGIKSAIIVRAFTEKLMPLSQVIRFRPPRWVCRRPDACRWRSCFGPFPPFFRALPPDYVATTSLMPEEPGTTG